THHALHSFPTRRSSDLLLDTGKGLESLPQIIVSDDTAARIRSGNPAIVRGRDAPVEADEACAFSHGKLLAIGSIEAGMFRPKRRSEEHTSELQSRENLV